MAEESPAAPLAEAPDYRHFWPTLLRAVGTEPREIAHLRGASGVDHTLVAAGVDEERKRLVVISKEAKPESAAMAQTDLQAALQDIQVVVARPVVLDAGAVGRSIEERSGKPVFTGRELAEIGEEQGKATVNPALLEMFGPMLQQIQNARGVGSIDFMQGLSQLIAQMSQAQWEMPEGEDDPDKPIVDFSALLENPVVKQDGELGVCPIPIYEFQPDELELIHSGKDEEAIEAVLRQHDVLQYFFPAPDQTALAVIDRGHKVRDDVEAALQSAPVIGHPFGPAEIVPVNTEFPELLDILKEKGYVAEGEVGYDITGEGESARASVKFRPREGFVTKLINRFEVKINLKSLFKIG